MVFTSDFDEDDAYFELYSVDEAGSRDPVMIEDCTINGERVIAADKKYISMKIKKGKKYEMLIVTDQEELFSGEVRMYAYR